MSSVFIVEGKADHESDRRLARAFTELLGRKHPGTRWHVDRVKSGRAPKAPTGEPLGSGPGRKHNDGDGAVLIAA